MTKSHAKSNHKRGGKAKQAQGFSSIFWWSTGFIMGSILTGLIFYRYPSSIETTVAKKDQTIKEVAERIIKKPKFDFYTILPEMEVVLPQEDTSQTATRTLPSPEQPRREVQIVQANPHDSYVLQLASFKHYADADQLKAQLALIGFEVNIEKVTLNDEVWHRVRLGPFNEQYKAQEQQQRLSEQNISSLLLKLKS